jgi:hypothetical protein
MWAHYAGGHKGVCLAFAATRDPFSQSRQVAYMDEIPVLDPAMLLLTQTRSSLVYANHTMFSKARCWEYEKEWRLVDTAAGRVPFETGALKAVLLGVKANLATWIPLVVQAARARGVPVYKGSQMPRTFGIAFRAVEPPHQLYDPNG